MADERFPGSERGTDDRGAADRGTRLAAAPGKPGGSRARSKGVIFLLSAKGYAYYDMEPGSEAPTQRNRQVGQAIFDNSSAFASTLNLRQRQALNLDYDPLEIRIFTELQDILQAVPGPDVAGGKWVGAVIVTHATFRANARGRAVAGLWVMPDGTFADDLRAFAEDGDPEFSSLRSRFDPAGTLNIFACSGTDGDRELACAARAFFGLGGNVYIPRASIQIRDGGVLYLKTGDDKYRPLDPTRDIRTITPADCGG